MDNRLAIDGGDPVRDTMVPYGKQNIDDRDIEAVVEVLKSDWLTTGPKVEEFETSISLNAGSNYSVAVSSGTAALHAAMFAMDVGPGDEVVVPAITFAATANAVIYQGGTPVFADVDPNTLLIDPSKLESLLTSRTKVVIAVDYAGQPCDYDALKLICDRHEIKLVADACHSLGGTYKGRKVGSLADLSVFSFHPVKHVASGEGGAVTTNDEIAAKKIASFRNHGIQTDHHERKISVDYKYEMLRLGYNYRLSDIQSALGLSQMRKLLESVACRREIAGVYDSAFSNLDIISPVTVERKVGHAYHLYVIRLESSYLRFDRDYLFRALRAENIGVNVHYLPVYLHPYYQRLGYVKGICPIAEETYQNILSLPMFPNMENSDVEDVIGAIYKVTDKFYA